MAQLKYLDLEGLKSFWSQAKNYIDTVDGKKINYTDLVNDLTTGGAGVPLSAEQGKALKTLVDEINTKLTDGTVTVKAATDSTIGGVLSGGDITVAGTGAVTVNNAAQAAKLATVRTFTFTGGATGTGDFDGTGNVNIALTVPGTGHTHTQDQVDGLTAALAGKLSAANGSATNLGLGGNTVATGTVDLTGATTTAATQTEGTANTTVATTAFVKAAIDKHIASAQALEFKGTANDQDESPEDASIGDVYIAQTAGTIFGISNIEVGDMLIYDGSKWYVVQANITGAVTGPGTSIGDNLAVFSGTTGKVIADSGITKEAVNGAITASGTAVQTVTVPAPTGDANPTAQKSGTGVTIQLPAYLLKSTYDTAIAGISGTIKAYVDAAVADATISGEGVINHDIGDGAAETVTIADNVITISLKNYALASELDTAETEITALKALTAGLGSGVTVKKYVDDAVSGVSGTVSALSTRVDGLEGEIDANTAKLADVTSTVGALIDSKLNTAVGTSGVVATAIDSKLDAMFNKTSGTAVAGDASYIPTVAITTEEISGLFTEADTLARVGTARVGTARVAKSN